MGNYISMVPLCIYSIYNQILCFLSEYYNKRRVLNQEKLDNISIPKELLHIILNYDGRIKYRNGKYMNTLNDDDERYDIIKPIINKKLEIMRTIELDNISKGFYFEFCFTLNIFSKVF